MDKMDGGIEREIRELGDYVETQMKDLLNPNAGAKASSLRIVFRAVAVGKPMLDSLMRCDGLDYTDFGLKPRQGWLHDLKVIADYADAHGSDAADKIKKALPVAEQLTAEFKAEKTPGILPKVRLAKSKGIQY